VDVVVVETVRGRDGKRYPAGLPLPRAELNRRRHLVHGLVCRDGNSIRRAQAIMLESYGIRRSLGALHKDLAGYECPECADKAPEPAPAPQQPSPPAGAYPGGAGYLTGMLRDG
jgi:hypothetical protein